MKKKQGAVEIVYFRDVTDFKILYLEGNKIADNYKKSNESQTISTTIFVCETIHAYVIGRMLQTFHEIINPEHKVVVVQSESGIENVINEV